MSTTSCPRCSGQVTLPVGVSNETQVRCPLCRAQYTLADALVNMPPLLEVVASDAEADDDWFDEPRAVPKALASPPSPVDDITTPSGSLSGLEFVAPEAPEEEDELGDLAEPVDLDRESQIEALPVEDDDLVFDAPVAKAVPIDDDAHAEPGELEATLEFGDPQESEAETLEFDDAEPEFAEAEADDLSFDDEPEASEAPTLEFGAAKREDEIEFDFDEPARPSAASAETIEFSSAGDEGDLAFDLETPARDPAGEGLREFEDLHVEPSADAEDIPLDEGEPVFAAAAVEPEAADGKKGKKKKEKKPKAPKAAGRRSSVGTLVSVLVTSLLAVFAVLYGVSFVSPDYDFLGLAQLLPSFMAPQHGETRQYVAGRPTSPPPDAAPSLETPAPATDLAQPESVEPAPAEPAPTEPAAADPAAADPAATDPAAAPAATDPAAAAPADPAADPAATPPEAAAPAADAENDPFADSDPAAPAEMPADAPPTDPAPAPVEPAPEAPAAAASPAPAGDDPFAPAPEATPPEEMPAEGAASGEPAPAADDPFATPAEPAPADATPAADDPFAAPADSAQPEPLPEPEAAAAEPLGPRTVTPLTQAEVMGAVQATVAARQQLSAAEQGGDDAALRKAKTNFYVSLFGMADAVTQAQLGEAADALAPQVAMLEPALKQQLAADPKQLDALKLFGGRWFTFPKRPNNGIALVGTVQAAEQVGKLYQAKLKLGDAPDAMVVTVVSARDPQLSAGDNVLSLGSIVEQPTDQLAGYEGSDPAVVWSGLTMKLAPAAQ